MYFSQTGQLRNILESSIAPLFGHSEIEVTVAELRPKAPYPFPWPVWRFFNTFPETVYEDFEPIEPLEIGEDRPFDLVILAYQVWFLSPSLPTVAFLHSQTAERILPGTPVITMIGCRNMWLMAQERVKAELDRLGANLIDNAVLIDSAHAAFTFISTPAWLLSGNRGPFLGGLIPAAGVSDAEIADCQRFGEAIAAKLPARSRDDKTPMLAGLGAVRVNEELIASEKIAKRSFHLWGALLRKLGPPSSPVRQIALAFYILFLLLLILTVAPLGAIARRLLRPLNRRRNAAERAYFAAPSGEAVELAV